MAGDLSDCHNLLSPKLLSLIREAGSKSHLFIDVGCGEGTLTVEAAEIAGKIVGIDVAEERIKQASRIVEDRCLDNVTFRVADGEITDYRSLVSPSRIDAVIANLCMSDSMIIRSWEALDPGGNVIFCCLEEAQWQETGRASRFAYSQERMREVLKKTGFTLEHLSIDREVLQFSTISELETCFSKSPLRPKWEKDGRWMGLMRYFDEGGRTITSKSHMIVKAVKGGKNNKNMKIANCKIQS